MARSWKLAACLLALLTVPVASAVGPLAPDDTGVGVGTLTAIDCTGAFHLILALTRHADVWVLDAAVLAAGLRNECSGTVVYLGPRTSSAAFDPRIGGCFSAPFAICLSDANVHPNAAGADVEYKARVELDGVTFRGNVAVSYHTFAHTGPGILAVQCFADARNACMLSLAGTHAELAPSGPEGCIGPVFGWWLCEGDGGLYELFLLRELRRGAGGVVPGCPADPSERCDFAPPFVGERASLWYTCDEARYVCWFGADV